ncbi:hypothetical protein LINPERPRIM_LOCUS9994 [Linum perenne]
MAAVVVVKVKEKEVVEGKVPRVAAPTCLLRQLHNPRVR